MCMVIVLLLADACQALMHVKDTCSELALHVCRARVDWEKARPILHGSLESEMHHRSQTTSVEM